MLAITNNPESVGVLRRDGKLSAREIVMQFLEGQSRAKTRDAYEQSLKAFSVFTQRHPDDFIEVAEQFITLGRCAHGERPEDASARINGAVAMFISNQTAAGLNPSTINVRASALRELVKHAVFHGFLANQLTTINLPEVQIDGNGVERAASRDDIRLLKDRAAQQAGFAKIRDLAILHLLHPIGQRIGGIDRYGRRTGVLGMNVCDLRLDAAMIVGKGKQNPSRFPLPEEIADDLAAYSKSRGGNPDDPLFVGIDKNGRASKNRLDPAVFRRKMIDWKNELGVAGRVNPHSLRHRVGTDLARSSSPLDARDQLGHADVATTTRYYVGADRDRLVGAIGKL